MRAKGVTLRHICLEEEFKEITDKPKEKKRN
jgi:hypothetical protein